MAALQQKVNPREQIVGWFSTHAEVSGSDALIQSFYANECASPALLTVDTSLRDGALAVRAHASRALSIQGRELAREFQEVACRITSTDLEQLGTDLLATEETRLGAQEEEEEVVEALHRLRAALSTAAAYVDAVVVGGGMGDQLFACFRGGEREKDACRRWPQHPHVSLGPLEDMAQLQRCAPLQSAFLATSTDIPPHRTRLHSIHAPSPSPSSSTRRRARRPVTWLSVGRWRTPWPRCRASRPMNLRRRCPAARTTCC